MRNFLEKTLLSILLAISVLLGLSFWLNIKFNFNILSRAHWDELAKLQASNTPVDTIFYISMAVALFIFITGLYEIFHSKQKPVHQIVQPVVHIQSEQQKEPVIQPVSPVQSTQQIQPAPQPIQPKVEPMVKEEAPIQKPQEPETQDVFGMTRPPRLHIPKNMAEIAAVNHAKTQTVNTAQKPSTQSESPYNSVLSQTLADAGYVVKPTPVISGWKTNVFAIGPNEIVWLGGVDCDIETIKKANDKLHSVFESTLEDITVHIYPFIFDTMGKYEPGNNVMVFHSIDEFRSFISKHPADKMSDAEKENFDAYSEYIDTIIQYVKNV